MAKLTRIDSQNYSDNCEEWCSPSKDFILCSEYDGCHIVFINFDNRTNDIIVMGKNREKVKEEINKCLCYFLNEDSVGFDTKIKHGTPTEYFNLFEKWLNK